MTFMIIFLLCQSHNWTKIPSQWKKRVEVVGSFLREKMMMNLVTCLKVPFALCSHWRRSKNSGMVALRNSASGIKVISRKGPTIPDNIKNTTYHGKRP